MSELHLMPARTPSCNRDRPDAGSGVRLLNEIRVDRIPRSSEPSLG